MRRQVYLNDNKKRILYKKLEITQKLLKMASYFCKEKSYIAFNLNRFYLHILLKNSFKTRIKNYCILSGRARSVYKKFRVSRIFLRKLGAEGFFFGLKKASW